MKTAKRLEGISEYYFSEKLREIEALNQQGAKVINLGIGSPDLPPHPDVIEVLQQESARANTHAYQSYKGAPILREAMRNWYHRWYGVELDAATEILPLVGSKEGIMHICMTYIDAGDEALVPDPGYPTYTSAVRLAGGTARSYVLQGSLNWQPDLQQLARQDLSRVKLMFVNYPHMPTGKLPDRTFFTQLVQFAQQHQILLVHDNPYSFILNDTPLSLLSIPGAKACVLELNSLSKSQNMAGWRVGMLCGSPERIDEVLRFKSNMDSGMFLPIQVAAAKALSLDQDWYDQLNAVYRRRKQKALALLDLLGCSYDLNQAGMFVWAAVPAQYQSGFVLSDMLLHNSRVFITPGGIFGAAGNSYIRVSLCSTEATFDESISRVESYLKTIDHV